MRAAIYARVSTTDQNCELQLVELREYIHRRGWESAGEFVDTGWSGGKASRPEFDRLLAAAARREFDVVLCWKLDRFGRSLLNCKTALQQLQSQGIRFIATSQSIDTDESNPAARFPSVTKAIRLLNELRRQYPQDRAAELWKQVYPVAILGYDAMN
jgi:putative DNA-invertase from lambdoid prophage Rac